MLTKDEYLALRMKTERAGRIKDKDLALLHEYQMYELAKPKSREAKALDRWYAFGLIGGFLMIGGWIPVVALLKWMGLEF